MISFCAALSRVSDLCVHQSLAKAQRQKLFIAVCESVLRSSFCKPQTRSAGSLFLHQKTHREERPRWQNPALPTEVLDQKGWTKAQEQWTYEEQQMKAKMLRVAYEWR